MIITAGYYSRDVLPNSPPNYGNPRQMCCVEPADYLRELTSRGRGIDELPVIHRGSDIGRPSYCVDALEFTIFPGTLPLFAQSFIISTSVLTT